MIVFILSSWLQAEDLESLFQPDGASRIEATPSSSISDQGFWVPRTPLSQYLWDFARKSNQQAEFRSLLEKIDDHRFEEAILSWSDQLFESQPSLRRIKGVVLSWLAFQVGFEQWALHEFFQHEDPNSLPPTVLKLWADILPPVGSVLWTDLHTKAPLSEWEKVVGPQVLSRVVFHRSLDQISFEDFRQYESKLLANSPEREWVLWSFILKWIDEGEPLELAKRLNVLLKLADEGKTRFISKDLASMTAARLLYQAGLLEAAIQYYQKVPKSSDLWPSAREEMGWAFIRLAKPAETLSAVAELTLPIFHPWARPEAHLLAGVAYLRVCDYPKVMDTLQSFATLYQKRYQVLDALSKQVDSNLLIQLVTLMKKKQDLRVKDLDRLAHQLPYLIHQSERLKKLVALESLIEKEQKLSEKILARSVTVGINPLFESLKKNREQVLARIREEMVEILKSRAALERNNIQKILSRMHVLEAEVLTQVGLAPKLLSGNQNREGVDLKAQKVIKLNSEPQKALKFPQALRELWFDELGQHQYVIKKGCSVVTH